MSRLAAMTVVLVVLGAASGVFVASANSEYSITASPNVDTPTREITFDNQTFTVSAIARIDPGETVSVSVSAPTGDFYTIPLYDADRRIIDRREGTNDSRVSFETVYADGEPYEPGTYALVVSHDGIFQAVHPLVISGYRVSVEAPMRVEQGSEVTISASLETIDDSKNISDVMLVIGNDSRDRRTPMSKSGDGGYSATIEIDRLDPGDYTLYVVVQGEEEALGTDELLGVSDSQPFAIEAEKTGDSDSGGDQSESTEDGNGGVTTTDSATITTNRVKSQTTSLGTTKTTRPTVSSLTTAMPSGSDFTTTTGDSTVITPRSTIPTDSTTTSLISTPGQPLGMAPVILAFAGFAWLGHRRAR